MWKIIIISCALTPSLGPGINICKIANNQAEYSTQQECDETLNKLLPAMNENKIENTYAFCQPPESK